MFIIPKILHLIWVGENEPATYFHANLTCWKTLMPEWEIKTWLNEDLVHNNIDQSYLTLIDKCRNGAQKADLLKYYIINKFGGYYVDADVEPKKSLDKLNSEDYNLIICHDLEITWEYIAVGFFAATANHPVLQHAIQQMYSVDYTNKDQHLTTGPGAMGKAYFAINENVKCQILPYWYFYRNKKGDLDLNGTYLTEDREDIFGSHRYAATWVEKDCYIL